MNVKSSQRTRNVRAGIAASVFEALLYAFPRETRTEYGAAMREDFARRLSVACDRGASAMWRLALRNLADVLLTGFGERCGIVGRDITYAWRSALRTPLFAAVVVVTIGVAIGANAAVDGVISAIAFTPVPVADPSSLAMVWEVNPRTGTTRQRFTFTDAAAVRSQTRTFDAVAATAEFRGALVGAGPPRMLYGEAATADLFAVLRIHPQAGRFFTHDDERAPANVVVLSDAVWRSAFGADPAILGRAVRIGDVARTVVGVAQPRVFEFDSLRRTAAGNQFWIPLKPATWRDAGHSLHLLARVRAGTSRDAVQADLNRIFAGLRRAHPTEYSGISARAPLVSDEVFRDVAAILWTFAIVVFGVLLVACANVANLFLSRATVRGAEIAVRVAVGAQRGRIVRQLLTETFLYAACGGVVGVLIAAGATKLLMPVIPASFSYVRETNAGWVVFALSFAFVVVAALLSGAGPAFAAARGDIAAGVNRSGRAPDAARGRRTRAMLVAAEIALAVAIVSTAGLSVRSLQGLVAQPLGMSPAALYALDINPSPRKYDTADKAVRFFELVRSRVLATPGVSAAAWTNDVPGITTPYTRFAVVGRAYARGSEPAAEFGSVSPGAFAMMRVPLVAGRTFEARDGMRGAPVAVVNAAFARSVFGSPQAALGARVRTSFTTFGAHALPRTIVGIVGNVRSRPGNNVAPAIFFPLAQAPTFDAYLVVRADGAPAAAAARGTLAGVDPLVPPPSVTSLESALRAATGDQELAVWTLGVLAVIALALACAGIFAVMSYDVARRTHEIGVRTALGARAPSIIAMVLRSGAPVTLTGIAGGLVLSAAAVKATEDQLIDYTFLDPAIFAYVALILGAAILAATLLPAWRAVRVRPAIALRYQ